MAIVSHMALSHAGRSTAPTERYWPSRKTQAFVIPYLDLKELQASKAGVALAQTVRQNFEGFTKREIKDAT